MSEPGDTPAQSAPAQSAEQSRTFAATWGPGAWYKTVSEGIPSTLDVMSAAGKALTDNDLGGYGITELQNVANAAMKSANAACQVWNGEFKEARDSAIEVVGELADLRNSEFVKETVVPYMPSLETIVNSTGYLDYSALAQGAAMAWDAYSEYSEASAEYTKFKEQLVAASADPTFDTTRLQTQVDMAAQNVSRTYTNTALNIGHEVMSNVYPAYDLAAKSFNYINNYNRTEAEGPSTSENQMTAGFVGEKMDPNNPEHVTRMMPRTGEQSTEGETVDSEGNEQSESATLEVDEESSSVSVREAAGIGTQERSENHSQNTGTRVR